MVQGDSQALMINETQIAALAGSWNATQKAEYATHIKIYSL